jgi:hypothetical protein
MSTTDLEDALEKITVTGKEAPSDSDADEEEQQTASKSVVRRVTALRKLQFSQDEIRVEYKKERLALEQKYDALYAPMFEERKKLVSGESAPELTEEEESAIPEEVRRMAKPILFCITKWDMGVGRGVKWL